MTPTLIALAILHWLGDFVLQSRWMADNKSKRWDALFSHVATYAIVLWFGLCLYSIFALIAMDLDIIEDTLFWYVVINAALHAATDFFTSRATSRLYKQNRIHAFFVIVGLDQMIHGLTLLLTLPILLP